MEDFLGEIRIFGFDSAPRGWAFCNGQILPIQQNSALFSILGTTYGGDGVTTFALPDMRSRAPLGFGEGEGLSRRDLGGFVGTVNEKILLNQMPAHSHTLSASAPVATNANSVKPAGNYYASTTEALYAAGFTEETVATKPSTPNVSPTGGDSPHNNMQPYLALNFCICIQGMYPSRDGELSDMQFIGEVRMFAGSFAPGGWAFCDGAMQSITGNDALLALLGTTFGGDGATTFALPDLRGRVPIGTGQGTGLTNRDLGQSGGVETVTLSPQQMPIHSHNVDLSSIKLAVQYANGASSGSSSLPSGKYIATVPGLKQFGKTKGSDTTAPLFSISLANDGGNLPHNNMQPSLGVNFIIALSGVFPKQV